MAGISASKNELRVKAKSVRAKARRNFSVRQKSKMTEDLIAWLADHADVRTIAGYWPIHDEFDCRDLLLKLERCGYQLALPVVVGPGLPLAFRSWSFDGPLKDGPFGTRQPAGVNAEVIPDVVLAPMLAFDAAGARLGYGGGYYDRSFASLRAHHRQNVIAIGLGFAAQEVSKIMCGEHDQRLDAVLTEAGFRKFGSL